MYLLALTKYLQRKRFTLEADVRRLVPRHISDMVLDGNVPASSQPGEVGSDPWTEACVSHIVASIPAGVVDKVETSVLFAVGINTGGRAGSLHRIERKDIAIAATEGNFVQLNVKFTHTGIGEGFLSLTRTLQSHSLEAGVSALGHTHFSHGLLVCLHWSHPAAHSLMSIV